MAWTPTKAIITPRAIPDNLLTYLTNAVRQAEALSWAGDGGLKLIKTFSSSVANRNVPVYPAIAFTDDNDDQPLADDIIEAGYRFTLELSVQNRDPDEAVRQARIYHKAFSSMIVNCPAATLGANTGGTIGATHVFRIETGFLEIKVNEKKNDFLQQFQMRISCGLTGSAYI